MQTCLCAKFQNVFVLVVTLATHNYQSDALPYRLVITFLQTPNINQGSLCEWIGSKFY